MHNNEEKFTDEKCFLAQTLADLGQIPCQGGCLLNEKIDGCVPNVWLLRKPKKECWLARAKLESLDVIRNNTESEQFYNEYYSDTTPISIEQKCFSKIYYKKTP